MTMMKKLLAVTLLGVALSVSMSSAPAANEPPPVRIAVVNIVTVFNKLDVKKAGDSEIELLGKKLEDERRGKEDELTNLKKEVLSYDVNSPEYKDTQEKMIRKAMDLQSFSRYMEQKVLLETRLRTAAIYRSMNKAIADFSREKGIGLVLATDDPDLSNARSQEELLAKITVRKVIYFHESFDITNAIVDKMNTDAKTAPK
jgi:Skp family chaperone for outer membrane proteins